MNLFEQSQDKVEKMFREFFKNKTLRISKFYDPLGMGLDFRVAWQGSDGKFKQTCIIVGELDDPTVKMGELLKVISKDPPPVNIDPRPRRQAPRAMPEVSKTDLMRMILAARKFNGFMGLSIKLHPLAALILEFSTGTLFGMPVTLDPNLESMFVCRRSNA